MLTRIPGILASRRADVTWLEREFVPGLHTLESRAASPRVFDVDDAIWLTGAHRFAEEIAAEAYGVIAGNQFIAQYFAPVARKIWVVPTSVDTEVWKPRTVASARWTIGWTGTSSNLPYLQELDEPLGAFLGRHPESELLVVCDRRPRFRHVRSGQVRFEHWSAKREVGLVQQMRVGLMPLPQTEWALGKCGFKMLLYMACGVPVIASPVGVSEQLLKSACVGLAAGSVDEWHSALCRLAEDAEFAAAASAAGRRLVVDGYSVKANSAHLGRIFTEAAEG